MRCPHCGFLHCSDREQCIKDSRYDIEDLIEAEREHGPFEIREDDEAVLALGIIAGRLMEKWFPDG